MPQKFPSNEQICSVTTRAACAAVERYKEISGMGAWDTPELWMQSSVALALHDELNVYVMVEPRVSDLRLWALQRHKKADSVPTSEYTGGRIDIALFPRTHNASDARTKILIEVKKCAGPGSCIDDIARLRGLREHIPTLTGGIMVAYLQRRTKAELDSDIKLTVADFRVLESGCLIDRRSSQDGEQFAIVCADVLVGLPIKTR